MRDLSERSAALAPSVATATLRGLAPLILGVGLAALLQAVGPSLGGYYAKVLTDVGINIVLAVSLNLVNGFTGQFSIGHAGFMAVGGYVAGAARVAARAAARVAAARQLTQEAARRLRRGLKGWRVWRGWRGWRVWRCRFARLVVLDRVVCGRSVLRAWVVLCGRGQWAWPGKCAL